MGSTPAARRIFLTEYEASEEYSRLKLRLKVATERVFEKEPREFQLRVALAIYSGYDVMCIAATNSGNTLSFIMPIVLDPKAVIIVISPLKSIMDDHVSDGLCITEL